MKHFILSGILLAPFSIQAAATLSPYTTVWKTEGRHADDPANRFPLIGLTSELFAVGRHNKLIIKSCTASKSTKTDRIDCILAEHPDYLTHPSTYDAEKIPAEGPPGHPHHIITQNVNPEAGALTGPAIPVSTKHQSPILGCAQSENTLASVSRWHIVLTRRNADPAPEIIAHKRPLLFPLTTKESHVAEQGRYSSDNWMCCIDIHQDNIITGQFDGSIFLWKTNTAEEQEPLVFAAQAKHYTESCTVKQVQFSADGNIAYALSKNGLAKIFMASCKRAFRPKHEDAAYFESMYVDEDHKVIYIGSANGTVYRYYLEQKRIEPFADLSGFSSRDKKINVIKKIGALLCLGTNGGNLYTCDLNRHPSTQKVLGGDTSPICDLLPIGKRELIISRQNGTLERILLSFGRKQ